MEKGKPVQPLQVTLSAQVPSEEAGYYSVTKGDTAFSICKHYNITMSQLREWNNLNDFGEIKEGQKLIVKK